METVRTKTIIFRFVVVVFIVSNFQSISFADKETIDLEKGLVGHWDFEEKESQRIVDYSENQNNGVLMGTPHRVRRDNSNQALFFDAHEDEGVIIPHSKSLNITDAITVAAWFKLESEDGMDDHAGGNIVSKSHKDKGLHWVLKTMKHNGATRLAFLIHRRNDTLKWVSVIGETELKANQWYHVTATYSNCGKKLMEIYLDGVQDGKRTYNGAGILGEDQNGVASDVYIGLWGASHPFWGAIDDVRIYNRALNDEELVEVASHYFHAAIDYSKWPKENPTIQITPQKPINDKLMTVQMKKGSDIIYERSINSVSQQPFSIKVDYPVDIARLTIQVRDKVNDPQSAVKQSFERDIVVAANKNLKSLLYYSFYLKERFQEISTGTLDALKRSPYNGFSMAVSRPYEIEQPLSYPDISEKIDLINDHLASKHLWPMVYLNRMVGCPKVDENGEYPYKGIGKRTTCPRGTDNYFGNINIMDIYNDTGAREDFEKIFETALKIAKDTGAPGVYLEPEAYNNYGAYHVEYLAQQYNTTEEEIIEQLIAIGSGWADKVHEIYQDEDQTVTLWFYVIPKGSIEYIVQGILERAQKESYRLKVINGYAGSYYYKSVDHAKKTFIKKYEKEAERLHQFGDYYEIGSVILPFESMDSLERDEKNDWVYRFYSEHSDIKGIEDFKPIFDFMFNTSDYVWIYGAGSANYSEFEEGRYEAVDAAITDSISRIVDE